MNPEIKKLKEELSNLRQMLTAIQKRTNSMKATTALEKGFCFPNGFSSWRDTFYECAGAIERSLVGKDSEYAVVRNTQEACGHAGLYDLAEKWADEFEALHAGREWDGEFFDVVDEFITTKLYQAV